jgi:hypothetical protein
MGKSVFLILWTVGLVTGIMFGTGVGSASAAGEGDQSPSAASAGHNYGERHDSYWEYYRCFYNRSDAEDCCRQLHLRNIECKIKHENNRWCVYIHRNH